MTKRTGSRRLLPGAMLIAGLIIGLGGVASATVIKQALTATAHAPKARGRAKLMLRNSSRGTFAILARRLAPSAAYDVVVDGIKVGALTTRTNGVGKVRFSSPKHRHNALLGFEARGASVVVRDHDGNDVLECDMPDSKNPKAVACCLPDDDGVECEDRTPETCLKKGGTVSSATGCFPDPCATPPPGAVVCCIGDSAEGAFCDDAPAVDCEDDLTAKECAAAHGTAVEAPSCEPNPCKPVPPVELVVCCVPEDDKDKDDKDETECEIRTPDRCAKLDGTVSKATSCHPNPCAKPGDDDGKGDDGDHKGDDGDHKGDDGGHKDDDGDHEGGDGDD